MAKSDESFVSVHIKKWDEYNPRSDVKRSSWFRFEHSIVEDSDFYEFTHEEFKAWIYILSQASRKNTARPRVNYAHASATARLSKKGIDGAIEKLIELGIVTRVGHADVTDAVRGRNVDVTDVSADVTSTYATYETRRDVRDETKRNETPAGEPPADYDLEALYQSYPLKKGKAEGLARARVQIKTPADYDALAGAIARYTEDLKRNGTAAKYVKHFSTFIGSNTHQPWRDWVDPDAGQATLPMASVTPLNRAEAVSQTNQAMAERVKRGEL